MDRFAKSLEEAAFTELAARYHAPALRVATGMLLGMSMADDAVQEAFVRVVKSRHHYDKSRPFAAWFFTILRHICLDIRRRETRFSHAIGAAMTHQDMVDEVRKPDVNTAADLLAEIDPEDQQLLMMKVVNGLTFKEVSEVLGCSEEAAKKRAQRALKRLRESLENSGILSPFVDSERN